MPTDAAPGVRRRRLIVLAALAVLPVVSAVPAAQSPADLLIRNVRVVHGDGRVTRLADVVVRGGLVEAVRPLHEPVRGPGRTPARRVIYGDGLTLLPGLIDAHVHGGPWTWAPFLRHGITTVRDFGNDAAYVFPLAAETAADRPRIVASGPALDVQADAGRASVEASSVGEARAAARGLIEAGARVILAAPRVEPALLSVLVSEARARGVPVAAALGVTTAAQAAELGVTSIEQLGGIVESVSPDAPRLVRAHATGTGGYAAAMLEWRNVPLQRLEALARDLAARGVVMVPTLAAHEATSCLADLDFAAGMDRTDVPPALLDGHWNPSVVMARAGWTPEVLGQFKQAQPILQQFVGIFARVGGRVVAGSGAGQPLVAPGASLHRELELLVLSGLSPASALASATAEAAALLGIQDRAGTVDAGKAADLLLVAGDPLTDIRSTRKIVAVVKDGVPVGTR